MFGEYLFSHLYHTQAGEVDSEPGHDKSLFPNSGYEWSQQPHEPPWQAGGSFMDFHDYQIERMD